MEDHFTVEEISQLLYEATDPKYLKENLWHPGFTKCQIQKRSKLGLLLVTGNDDTGYNHIMKRHNWVRRDTFKKDELELDTPTTFEYSFVPIFHILAIADDVFSQNNKLPFDPNRPTFEAYEGSSSALPSENDKYRLILYRDAKIIHTLYPLKSSTKKKHILHLVQAGISVSENWANHQMTIKISYLNKENQKLVELVILHDNYQKSCLGKYYVYDTEGVEVAKYDTPMIKWRHLLSIDAMNYYRYTFDYKKSGIHSHIKNSLKKHGFE